MPPYFPSFHHPPSLSPPSLPSSLPPYLPPFLPPYLTAEESNEKVVLRPCLEGSIAVYLSTISTVPPITNGDRCICGGGVGGVRSCDVGRVVVRLRYVGGIWGSSRFNYVDKVMTGCGVWGEGVREGTSEGGCEGESKGSEGVREGQ